MLSPLLIIWFLTPIYGTTDDFILDSWLNGTYTGESESYSIFISSLASNFFGYLYLVNNSLPWYSLILLILTYLSSFYIIYLLRKDKNISSQNFLILLIIIFFFLIWSYLKITYTSTGIILAVAALISFYYSIKQESNSLLINSIVFSFLAFSIRPESIVAAAIFFYPIFLLSFKNFKLLFKKLLILVGAVVFIYGLNWIIESGQQQDFKEYRTWSKQVQSFAGRPTMEIVAKNIGNSGWTTSEYNSFKDLTYFDPNIFNENWIISGLKITKNSFFKPNLELSNLFNILKNIYNSSDIFYIVLLFILVLVLKNFHNNKKLTTFFLSNFLIMNFLLGLYFQNVARVSVPILLGITFFLIIIMTEPIKNNELIVISLITIAVLSFSVHTINTENNKSISKNIDNSNFISANFSQNIILIHGNQEFAQFSNPYSLNKIDQNPNVFMIGNWDTFSPHWYKRAKNLGLDGKNLTYELLNNKKLLWTAPSVPDTTFNLKNLLKEQGLGEVEAVRIDSLPDGNDIRTLSLKE